MKRYTIGELATHSGVSTRSLRHYDKLGLVKPSGRTPAGYRVYTEPDVLALHRVIAYQQMGVALKDITPLLADGEPPLAELLQRQVATVEREVMRHQRLLTLLKRAQRQLQAGEPDTGERLLKVIRFMRAYEQHFSDEEMERLLTMRAAMDDAEAKRLRIAFYELIAGVREAMAHGASPDAPEVLALARKMLELGAGLPDDDAMRDHGREMFAALPALQHETGITPELFAYFDQALAIVREETA